MMCTLYFRFGFSFDFSVFFFWFGSVINITCEKIFMEIEIDKEKISNPTLDSPDINDTYETRETREKREKNKEAAKKSRNKKKKKNSISLVKCQTEF